ncbi:MAG TPA: sigma-70 family RNA polymerase sigma factor [Verrucomicrobiae bacterium]|nr:sigma-70 family RNA polymerase sigma factor [Verrucomicrobiae bacterium]
MTESQQLLAEYTRNGSETAFRDLVQRYLGLVYSCAVRLVGGDAHLAQDVAQTVFIHLARKAASLPPGVMLGGWLHRDTCFVAAKFLRQARRRQAREQQAALMHALPDHSQANLEQLSPILDEAINALAEEERLAILLRFFEQRDFRSVGAALCTSDDAARMRVTRALDKLQVLLKHRGVTLSVSVLAAALAAEAVTAAPVGLATSISAAALATTGAGATTALIKALTMNAKLLLASSLAVGGLAVSLVVQHRGRLQLEENNRRLQQQVQALAADNETLSSRLAQTPARPVVAANHDGELLRLRGEVGSLRQQLAEATNAQSLSTNELSAANELTAARQRQQQLGIAKMTYEKTWLAAFIMYAEQNHEYPTNFDQALLFWPSNWPSTHALETNQVPGLVPDNYEITYNGTLSSLTNLSTVIVLREKQPWQTLDGGWVRTYGFADGHVEIHKAEDGNFLPWEQQHMAATAAAPGSGP